jgi:hypothetical protein
VSPALLEASPYPLCFFRMDGHLITCNRAARRLFGATIWLQSDIFGMGERERRGLNLNDLPADGSFRIDRTERRTAYESMMYALAETGHYEVDLPIKSCLDDGKAEGSNTWYCRVLAQRHTDPVNGQPIMMVSHQDVTALRNVEAELGRIQMKQVTNKGLMMGHDSDVAGSLLTLLGEDWDAFAETLQRHDSSDVVGGGDKSVSERSIDASLAHMGLGHGSGQSHETTQILSLGSSRLSALRAVLVKADEWQFDVPPPPSKPPPLPPPPPASLLLPSRPRALSSSAVCDATCVVSFAARATCVAGLAASRHACLQSFGSLAACCRLGAAQVRRATEACAVCVCCNGCG